MIGLLRSEVLRARSRRIVTMLAVAVVLGVTVGITIAIFTTNAPTQAEIEQGQRRYQRELDRCLSGDYGDPEQSGYATLEELCAENVRPEYFGPQQIRFADILEILEGSAFMVILLGAVLGASLGGADWSSGNMATLLAWEPRRIRILAMRAIAVTVIVLVVTVFAQVVLTAGFAALSATKGSFEQSPEGFAGEFVWTVARLSGVAALFALMGLALATIGRSTVAGLGVLLGYLIIVEGFLSNLLFWVQKITFGRSAGAAVTNEPLRLFDSSAVPPTTFELIPSRAWLNLGVWALGLLALAAAAFRARDVT